MLTICRFAYCSLLPLILGFGLVMTMVVPSTVRIQEEETHERVSMECESRHVASRKPVVVDDLAATQVIRPVQTPAQAHDDAGRFNNAFSCRNGYGCYLRL